ncbi:MAG: proton-conducting transporter membrane subunit [Acidimicrobiales bacterium]
MNALVALPVVGPLMAAALALLASGRPRLQHAFTYLGSAVAVGAAVGLAVRVERSGAVSVHLGGWTPPLGITLLADLFAVAVLCVAQLTAFAVLVFSAAHPATARASRAFGPLYLVLIAGVSMSLLAADLFNLFVAFEIMLSASYVLLTLGGAREQIRRSMTYVVISLFASVLFITSLGLLYAAAGTVDMAQLSLRLAELPAGVRNALGLLLFVVFAIKAAVFPVFSWLPDSYPTAPAPVTAIFAGLATKVGVYALIRTQTLLFPRQEASQFMLVLAGLTMVVGVLGAIAQSDMKRILSFHIVSQIGHMLLGLALFSMAGLAGAVFFLLHQIPVKTSLFLVEGIIEQRAGTSRLDRVGGLVERLPLTAALFGLGALSLAGVPPLSGFVGKLALLRASFESGAHAIGAVSLVVSVLTLFSMVKIWNGVFWGEPMGVPDRASAAFGPAARAARPRSSRPDRTMLGAAAGCVAITLLVAAAAGPVYRLSERAAEGLLDPAGPRREAANR